MKKLIWILVSLLLLLVMIIAYYQLLYQSPRVDSGIAKSTLRYKAHKNVVNGVRFLSADSILLSVSVDSTMRKWNGNTGKTLEIIRHPAGISALDVSEDDSYAVTGSYDAVIRKIDLKSTAHNFYEMKGHEGTVWTVAISPDGKYIASGGEDKTIRIWDAMSLKMLRSWTAHTLTIWAIKFSPDGKSLVSASFDHSFKIWDINGNIKHQNHEHSQAIVDIAYSNNGNLIASTSDDQTIRIWNAVTGKLIRVMDVPEHVQAVAFSADDMFLLTGGRDKTTAGELFQNFFGDSHINKGVSARLWNVETGELLQTFAEHYNDVNDVAFSKNGKRMATASADHTVQLWKMNR